MVLAIWNEAINISSTWLASSMEEGLHKYGSANESIPVKEGSDSGENVDFSRPHSVSMWAKQGFLVAFNRAENLSDHVLKTEGQDFIFVLYLLWLVILHSQYGFDFTRNAFQVLSKCQMP